MIPALPEVKSLPRVVVEFCKRLMDHSDFKGEVSTSSGERLLQSTDNSIYQVIPQAVVYPRSAEDVKLLMKLMNLDEFSEVFVSARGGGTGTNGQALSEGIIVDMSKYMNRILEVNYEEGWARVEAGVVLDQLNAYLGREGYFFAPMVSTSSRATIGGMCATDGSGIGSLLYGKTSNHILELDLVMATGETFTSRSMSFDEWEKTTSDNPDSLVSGIYETVREIVTKKRQLIESVFPKLDRFMTGYNLYHAFENKSNINLNYIVSGSEGTLAMITEAKVGILKKPTEERVVVCKYQSFESGLRAADYLIKYTPTGIETIDGNIVALARAHSIWDSVGDFFSAPGDESLECVNYVQFTGYSGVELDSKVASLCAELDQRKGSAGELSSYVVASKKEDLSALWGMRKKGVGLLGSVPGRRKPQAFVEDTAVDPRVLADFIMDFRKVLDDHGLEYGMFGHIDAGCLHVRPALDLTDEKDQLLVRKLTQKIKELAKDYGGVLWGEHGKGFRGEFLPDFFGPELYEDLRKIKGAFDPNNRLNPGKFCTPPSSDDRIVKIDEAELRATFDKQIPSHVKSDFNLALDCNGNGACFNYNPKDVMCPSYRYSRSRLESPKGRASLMREWLRRLANEGFDPSKHFKDNMQSPSQLSSSTSLALADQALADSPASPIRDFGEKTTLSGRSTPVSDYIPIEDKDFSLQVYDSMNTCLSCKGCSAQCPIKVDIPELKSRFLNLFHTRYKRPLKDKLVRDTEKIHHLFSHFPLLNNIPFRIPFVRKMIEKATGLVDAPLLSHPPLKKRLIQLPLVTESDIEKMSESDRRKTVVIVQDPLTSFYEAHIVEMHVKLFQKLGLFVMVMPYGENGKAKHVKGFLAEFAQTAKKQHQRLNFLAKFGVSFVGIEPAVALTYREEYPRYVKDRQLYHVEMPQEYLWRMRNEIKNMDLSTERNKPRTGSKARKVVLFGHCGEKTATPDYSKKWVNVFSEFGLDVTVEPTGCCGMAGVYGHEKANQKSSRGIYDLHWKETVSEAKSEKAVMLATGASCRSQVKRYEGDLLLHPVQFLVEQMGL